MVHEAAEPRGDGSQRCSRCGLDITPPGGRAQWSVGDLVEVDETDTGVLMKLAQQASDDAPFCLLAS